MERREDNGKVHMRALSGERKLFFSLKRQEQRTEFSLTVAFRRQLDERLLRPRPQQVTL